MTDADGQVLVERRTELDVCELFLVTEQTLGRLVEPLRDMIKGI